MFTQMRYAPPPPSALSHSYPLFFLPLQPSPSKSVPRSALQIPKTTDILDHIHSLPEPAQSHAQATVRAIETSAMVHQEPQPGLDELIDYLERRNVRMGLCTRNFEYVCLSFRSGSNFTFSLPSSMSAGRNTQKLSLNYAHPPAAVQ